MPLTRLAVTATPPQQSGRVVLAAVDRACFNISDYQPLDRSEIFLAASASPKICSTTTGAIPPQDGKAGPPQLWGRPCAAERAWRAGEPGRDRCALEWRGEF